MPSSESVPSHEPASGSRKAPSRTNGGRGGFARSGKASTISDPDRLLSYAAWYYGKYAPPMSKLRTKLLEKSGDAALTDDILSRFASYADDGKNLESRISSASRSGKPSRKTANALIMKGFSRDDVRSAMSAEESFHDWGTRAPAVLRRMRTFAEKGKSRAIALSSLLVEYPELRDQIEEQFRANYPSDSEILRLSHGLPNGIPSVPSEKKKAFDRLLRQGFRYSDLAPFFGS